MLFESFLAVPGVLRKHTCFTAILVSSPSLLFLLL